ncbi:MAG: membrane protein insertion efficiency factor YidD [Candidatus Acidiferrales bacterium]
MTQALLLFVRVYQAALSPLLGGACRFHPSCSQYAIEAIERHGAARGAWLALRRLLRCRPFAAGGYDPVPDEFSAHAEDSQDVAAPFRSPTAVRSPAAVAAPHRGGALLDLCDSPANGDLKVAATSAAPIVSAARSLKAAPLERAQ